LEQRAETKRCECRKINLEGINKKKKRKHREVQNKCLQYSFLEMLEGILVLIIYLETPQ